VNTVKSAAVIVVLLVVLYGVYVALNKPDFFSPPPAPADVAPPLVEFGPTDPGPPHTVTPPLASGPPATSPADSTQRSVRGGEFQPSTDPASLPPPTSLPSTAPPPDPTASAGADLRRSNFETPAATTTGSQAPPLDASAAAPPPAASAPPANYAALTAYSLKRDFQEAEQLVADGKYRAALAKLSPYYNSADLTSADRGQLLAWLDALAAKVIYSREHLLAAPYIVNKSQTLYDIANEYKVSWLVLHSINRQVRDPMVLVQGTELKIVPGPFRAEVNLATSELTLFLGELYAGRFPFTIGDQPPRPGTYQVHDKRRDQTFYGLDGRVIPGNDPANPYGGYWIHLGGEVAIHGSAISGGAQPLGCISLSPKDAQDVNAILSLGSEVTIRR